MTEAEELAWYRDWHSRLLSGMRLWWKSPTYEQSCKGWSEVENILREPVPNQQQKGAEA